MVDNSLAVSHRDSGTAEFHAHLAAYALIAFNGNRRIMLYIFEQSAGTAGNNYGSLVCCKFFLNCSLGLGKVIRINHAHPLYADSAAEFFEIYCGSGIALEILSRGGVLLMASHSRDRVVKNDNG